MVSEPKPTHVQAAEDFLRDTLVGETFPKRYQSIVGNFVLEASLRPGSALEDLSFTLLRRKFKAAKVQLEPYGRETFPDLMLGFGNAKSTYYFEVKSKASSTRKFDVDLASVKQLFTHTTADDARYWESYYLLWCYDETPTTVTVKELEVGKLWELAGRTEAGLVKLGSGGTGRTKYIQRGNETFPSPQAFRKALIKTYEGLEYSPAEVASLSNSSAQILKTLYS